MFNVTADILELGTATVETRGNSPVGILDQDTGQRFLAGPIQSDD